MPNRHIYDITQPLSPELPVWPGDTPFQQHRTWTFGGSCPVNVSRVTVSTHAGTHADAPLHYDPKGDPVRLLDLSRYLGHCRVIDARAFGTLIEADELFPCLANAPPRILLRTYASFPHSVWDSNFTAIAASTIDMMASMGVVLIGVDTPSLDPETSKTMDAHLAVKRHGLSILEGLVLDHVSPGDYELIALPLNFAELDAAPVRAVLRSLS